MERDQKYFLQKAKERGRVAEFYIPALRLSQ